MEPGIHASLPSLGPNTPAIRHKKTSSSSAEQTTSALRCYISRRRKSDARPGTPAAVGKGPGSGMFPTHQRKERVATPATIDRGGATLQGRPPQGGRWKAVGDADHLPENDAAYWDKIREEPMPPPLSMNKNNRRMDLADPFMSTAQMIRHQVKILHLLTRSNTYLQDQTLTYKLKHLLTSSNTKAL